MGAGDPQGIVKEVLTESFLTSDLSYLVNMVLK